MNLFLNDSEIKTAIEQYVANQGISIVNKTVTVSITGGKAKGDVPAQAKAEVIITDDVSPSGNSGIAALDEEEAPMEPVKDSSDDNQEAGGSLFPKS